MITSSDLYSTNYCLTFDVAAVVVIDHVVVVVDATKTFLFRTICSNLQLLDNHHIQIFGA